MATILCSYCGVNPAIERSHVVPNFVGKHIKKNSTSGFLLNSWRYTPQQDIYKGPYLCAKCDNETFSSWESFYASGIWRNPLTANSDWGREEAILFTLSLAYRYTLHFIRTSPIQAHRAYAEWMRDLLKSTMQRPMNVGRSFFVYPYVFREITQTCGLMPGVNHLLQLAIYAECLPREGDLPNSMLVVIPNAIFLYCESDISSSSDNELSTPRSLRLANSFDARGSNVEMPLFLKTILNRLVGEGQAVQRQMGLWRGLQYKADMLVSPKKVCYVARSQDKKLLSWQRANCG